MRESDLDFVRKGLSETNWQDIPDDQKAVLRREDCDRRILDDFDRYRFDSKFKQKVFVASSNGVRMGYVSIGETMNPTVGLRFGSVLDFWVSPEHRGKGVGGRLLDHALDRVQKYGYSHSSLMVSATNRRALHVYEKRGFSPDRFILARRLARHPSRRR